MTVCAKLLVEATIKTSRALMDRSMDKTSIYSLCQEKASLYQKEVAEMGMPIYRSEVDELVVKLAKEQPNVMGPFLSFIKRVEEKGALDAKSKQLIAVALSVALHCESCIAFHTKKALDAGATTNELVETCLIATQIAGTSAMTYSKLVFDAIENFTRARVGVSSRGQVP